MGNPNQEIRKTEDIIKKITDRCSALEVFERRSEDGGYRELVIFNRDINEWEKVFIDCLGPAVKPPGKKPTRDDLRLTKDYGSIAANQTLFKKEFDDGSVIAMLWPWGDEVHTTLKITALNR